MCDLVWSSANCFFTLRSVKQQASLKRCFKGHIWRSFPTFSCSACDTLTFWTIVGGHKTPKPKQQQQHEKKKKKKKNSSSGYEIGINIKEIFQTPLEAVKSLFHAATCREPVLGTSPPENGLKKESVTVGHLWFHALHFPWCVTVINILLAQNTRAQWFTCVNCAVYLARASLPPGQAVPFSLSVSRPHLPSQSLPTLVH